MLYSRTYMREAASGSQTKSKKLWGDAQHLMLLVFYVPYLLKKASPPQLFKDNSPNLNSTRLCSLREQPCALDQVRNLKGGRTHCVKGAWKASDRHHQALTKAGRQKAGLTTNGRWRVASTEPSQTGAGKTLGDVLDELVSSC